MKKFIIFFLILPATFVLLTIFGIFDYQEEFLGSLRWSTPAGVVLLAIVSACIFFGAVAFWIFAWDDLGDQWGIIHQQSKVVESYTKQADALQEAYKNASRPTGELADLPTKELLEQIGKLRSKAATAEARIGQAYVKLEKYAHGPYAWLVELRKEGMDTKVIQDLDA